jgi:diguanylate cyclase (GGDEF)-like protein
VAVTDGGSTADGRRWPDRLLALPPELSGAGRRRARTLLGVSTALAVVSLPMAVLVGLLIPDPARNVPVVVVGLLFYLAIQVLMRRGHPTAAAWVFVSYFALVPLNGLVAGDVPFAIDLLFIPVIPVMAAVVLPARHVAIATAIAVANLLIVSLWSTTSSYSTQDFAVYVVILLAMTAAAAIMLTVTIDHAFDDVARTNVESRRLADELQVANADLEARVRSRTTELAEALRREQRLSAQLTELSLRDPLTGLHNRRHMDETVDRMFRYAQRSGDPLSIAIIDLDNFKSINDRLTHLVGDAVLTRTAQLLGSAIRGADELVRMGGEEFALLMPGTSLAEAATVCERIRQTLADHDWTEVSPGVVVTASFGVAATGASRTVSELIRSADEQLLKAKRAGKNQVLCAAADVA